MTTFQEPQPQSRRAVRQSERDDEAPAAFPSASGQPPFTPTTPLAPGQVDPRDMWDTTARRAAALSAPPAGGRRAALRPATPGAEPLSYSTQQRPFAAEPAPAPPQPQFRARGNAQARPVATEQPAAPEQPAYRPRDFSPGGAGRRAAAPVETAGAPAPASQPGWTQPINPSDLDYHTEARYPFAAPVQVTPPPSEHTLSRRELRALREQVEGASAPEAVAPPELVPPPASPLPPSVPVAVAPAAPPAPLPRVAPEPEVNTGLTSALAEFDQLALAQQAEFAAAPAAAPIAEPPAAAPIAAPPAAAPTAPQPTAQVAPPAAPPAAPVAPPLIAELPPGLVAAPTEPEPAPVTPASGHWAAQLELDEDELFETTVSRTVGATPTTTNALVLPSAPVGSDIRGALTGTGEIMLTGSIDLPADFAATGATAALDSHGIDALFESHDAELINTDSAPVRAIKAVSTHNSGQGVTHTQKPKGTRALTALVISAAAMAVIVAGLLVAALAMNVF